MKHSGFIVAGTHSGCGKTTVTMGLIAAFRQRGFTVQPFKSGPDYVDPGFHALAAGRPCGNLDTRMLGEDTVRRLYFRRSANADISITEGVMGLFDGAGASDERGSAAHLSKVLNLPVVLVIDARAMARSAGALALGFASFDSDVRVAGFILNRVGSERHGEMLREAVESATNLPVLGTVYREASSEHLPSRQLGLVPAWESRELQDKMEGLGTSLSRFIEWDALERVAAEAGEQEDPLTAELQDTPVRDDGPVIAVARDEAFCFYYEDNLDLLKSFGARLEFFSPLRDESLPDGTAAVWFGGGYPELHGETLAANLGMLESVRAAARGGMPVFGECGGYMYLSHAIVDTESGRHPMAELLPGEAVMGTRLRSLGYRTARTTRKSFFGPEGTLLEGHVFHWSGMTGIPEGARAPFSSAQDDSPLGADGKYQNVLGSWLHVHFASNPQAADAFVRSARQFIDSMKEDKRRALS